ncbi:hypothetical protein [Vibrio sp.]|uniref:hypothetical protein n=1 Tax=Vibrio sp. TaxID=678 RepID=UPI003D0ACCBD
MAATDEQNPHVETARSALEKYESGSLDDTLDRHYTEHLDDPDVLMVGLANGYLTPEKIASLRNKKMIKEAQENLKQLEREEQFQHTAEIFGVIVVILIVVVGFRKFS